MIPQLTTQPVDVLAPSWTAAEGSYGHYIAIQDNTGKQIARVLWGPGDGRRAKAIASVPELIRCLQALVPPDLGEVDLDPEDLAKLEDARRLLAELGALP